MQQALSWLHLEMMDVYDSGKVSDCNSNKIQKLYKKLKKTQIYLYSTHIPIKRGQLRQGKHHSLSLPPYHQQTTWISGGASQPCEARLQRMQLRLTALAAQHSRWGPHPLASTLPDTSSWHPLPTHLTYRGTDGIQVQMFFLSFSFSYSFQLTLVFEIAPSLRHSIFIMYT